MLVSAHQAVTVSGGPFMTTVARERDQGVRRTSWTPRLPYLLLLPAATIFIVLMAVPMIGAILLSLESWDGLRPPTWIGLANYWNLLQDQIFLVALGNTAYFVKIGRAH